MIKQLNIKFKYGESYRSNQDTTRSKEHECSCKL